VLIGLGLPKAIKIERTPPPSAPEGRQKFTEKLRENEQRWRHADAPQAVEGPKS
jgi:hypothetical protein